MRFLRDFYFFLNPGDRAVIWVALGLALACGFSCSALVRWRSPSASLGPSVTAPPFEMSFAAVAR